MSFTRRSVVLGAGAVAMTPFAFAQTRAPLPGGGSVMMPSPYDKKPRYPTYGEKVAGDVLIGYRNWRSTMSGYPECDGMIAVGRAERFEGLKKFMETARVGLSIQWGAADLVPGTGWSKDEKRYPVESATSEMGQELVQQLAVHRVGFFDVYDEPAHMLVIAHQRGVHVGVWLYKKNGGLKGARKIADKIAASCQP